MRLEKLMHEKNLVKVNGKLEAKTEYKSTIQRLMKSADIPDYDKIAERQNPLDPVVKKFEENGYTPTQAFIAFDEDEDEVLTLEEIKDGVKCLKIDLLDTERKLLFDNIDKNSDGVLTLEEWVAVLQPRLNAQREYIQIMKDLDIHDPLILEEQILDVLFKKRRLAAEVKVMRAARGKEMFARKKQAQSEQKALTDKILELER